MKKMKTNVLFKTTLLAVAVVFTTGCINPFSDRESDRAIAGGAKLQVTIATISASSIVPDVAELVSSYTVTLSRSGFSDITLSGGQTSFDFPDISPGLWTVTVEAMEENGFVVGRGTDSVDVLENETNSVAISVGPTSTGTGAVDITVTWPSGLVNEVGTATIAPLGGNAAGISANITGLPLEARYTALLDSGIYELLMVFRRDGTQVANLVVAVHVYDNVATTEIIELSGDEIGQAPAPPANLEATPGDDKVTLSWTDTSPVNDTYELQRKLEQEVASMWQDIATDPPLGATAIEYVDTAVFGGTTYNYRIRSTNRFGPVWDSDGWVQFDDVTPTTPQLAAPTLLPPDPLVIGGKILLSTNKPDNVRYYYTTDGATNPTFNSETLDPGPNTFAVWQYEGIVLNSAGDHELRVLVRADGWLTSAITTQTVTVMAGAAVTNNDKTGPGSLAAAIANAQDGDTIAFNDNYTIYHGAPSAIQYYIDDDITIDGAGYDITLDGGYGHRHVEIAANATVTIKNVRLWRGADRITAGDENGGSIRINPGAAVTIENVHFDDNGSANDDTNGGHIYNDGGTVSITDSTFNDGYVSQNGGAIANVNGGTITIRDSVFVRNQSRGNTTPYGGGAIWSASETTTNIIRSLFAGNSGQTSETFSSRSGGTIRAAGTIHITGSLFAENEADGYGGVFHVVNGAEVSVDNSVFVDNVAADYPLTDTLAYVGYLEPDGGNYGTLDITNASFAGNATMGSKITNSAFANGISGIIDPMDFTYSAGSGLGIGTGTGNIDSNPWFVRLPNAGSDGVWGTDDDDWGDMRLAAGSPGIDAGNNFDVVDDALDADGDGNFIEDTPDYAGSNWRIQNGTVDMGAVER